MMRGFLKGNASVLLEHANEMAPQAKLEASGYGFYASGMMEQLSDMPYDELIANDIVWVGTSRDVIERIEAVRDLCAGLTEVQSPSIPKASSAGRRSRRKNCLRNT